MRGKARDDRIVKVTKPLCPRLVRDCPAYTRNKPIGKASRDMKKSR